MISGSIANFANGVSQQAVALRLATQGELQVNGYSTVVDGLKKRPPTQQVANLGAASSFGSDLFSHTINRDEVEKYEVLASKTGVRVFTLEGEEKVVNAPEGFDYLYYSTAPAIPYRAVTVGDFTYFTNTLKKVELLEASRTPERKHEAIINIQAGNYAKVYEIKIDGEVKAQYQTPPGTSATQAPGVDASFIAARLVTGETVEMKTTVNGEANGNFSFSNEDTSFLGTGASTYADGRYPGTGSVAPGTGIDAAGGWIVKRFKSTIYLAKADGSDFSIEINDGYNGNAVKAIKGTVQDFSDVPYYCEDGVMLEVVGTPENAYDNYYIKFEAESSDTSKGVWKEVPGADTRTKLDPATMPHVLIREADGTFTFKPYAWDDRKAGDEDTLPAPSFVGKAVNEITFFKNRLGFLAGESVILSRHGSYFDFWRSTAVALLDDDPIDVASNAPGVSSFRSAAAFADRLVVFSEQYQLTMIGSELLTPKTASLRVSTAFAASGLARPVAAGNAIFFTVDRGLYSMVREYKIDMNDGLADAEDVTSHVPQYIPQKVHRLAASTHEDILVALTREKPDEMFVYKYYWSRDQKLQSSWSKWRLPGAERIIDASFINSLLYLVVQRDGDIFIEKMEIQPGGTDLYSDFVCNLDRRFEVSIGTQSELYDPNTDSTRVTLPTEIDDDYICVTAGSASGEFIPGIELAIKERDGAMAYLRGDQRGKNAYFGILYEMRYRVSTIYVRRESQGGGTYAVTEGRLQLVNLLIQYSDSAYFTVEVTPMGRQPRVYKNTGRIMGDPSNKADTIPLNSGTYKVPILSKNDRVTIDIVNNSYLPSSLLSAEWVGKYDQKSRRI